MTDTLAFPCMSRFQSNSTATLQRTAPVGHAACAPQSPQRRHGARPPLPLSLRLSVMRALLLMVALAIASAAHARDAVIKGGRSKNGLFELRIVQDTGGDTSDYIFAIYDTRSKKRIMQLHDIGGYHRYEQACQASTALWNDSSSFVALTDSDSRHTECTYIFHVSDTSVRRLIVPDFVQNALGRVDATETAAISRWPYFERWRSHA